MTMYSRCLQDGYSFIWHFVYERLSNNLEKWWTRITGVKDSVVCFMALAFNIFVIKVALWQLD